MGSIADSLILSDRQLAILQAVVEEYVTTALPVSSAIIAELPGIKASSATVRNELGRLEELGLLLQPYTSAGRIPTDLGYRYYVDHLMTVYHRHRPTAQPLPPMQDPGVASTCKLLGDLTKYTALALVPGWQQHRLEHIELAAVGEDQLLVMLVTDNRQVMHSLSTVHERPNPARLRQLNDLLNQEFSGRLLSQMSDEALAAAVTRLPHQTTGEFYRHTPEMVRRGLPGDGGTRFYIEGTDHLFEQQDFAEMPKLRALMEALHEESVFSELFSRGTAGEIQVSIGAENPHAGLDDCAIVFTSMQISPDTTGRVGILGPRRMPYRQVISTLDSVVRHLENKEE